MSLTADDAIQFLNELLRMDRAAIAALVINRVPCNEALANHKSVQVATLNDGYLVGMLGILNGLFGVDEAGFGPIAAVYDGENLSKFQRTVPETVKNYYVSKQPAMVE